MGFCEPHNFEFGKGHEDVSCPYCKIAQLRAELLKKDLPHGFDSWEAYQKHVASVQIQNHNQEVKIHDQEVKISGLRDALAMARVLCQIYFEIAEEHIPAEKIREKLEEKIQEWTRKLL